MKKKNILLEMITILALMMAFTSACGNREIKVITANAMGYEMIENTGDISAKVTSSSVEKIEEQTTEQTEEPEEITYRETESLYLIEGVYNDGKMYDTSTLERVSKNYDLTKNVDVYWLDMDLAGYTKDGVSVDVISKNDEWCYCIFESTGYLIKTDELMDAIAKPVVAEATPSAPVAESPKPESTPVESEPAMDIPVVEEPVAVESDKYTPEEAIAVYRSLMEANGIAWNPSLRDGGSWGTGIFYLEKGWIEDNIDSQLAAFQYGSGDGVPCTNYYLEVTGFDENCVYIIEWSD